VVVPLDRTANDYIDVLTSTIDLLASGDGADSWRRLVFPRLVGKTSEEYRFRRDTEAKGGLIPWRDGERLISSARQLMVSCAKSYVEKLAHFSNRLGQFGNRYMDHVMMGQTSPGSYIVVAYVPTHEDIPIRVSSESAIGFERIDTADTTNIATATVDALKASREALDHFHSHGGSLAGFGDGVIEGISYELVTSLFGIVDGADVADITIDVSSPNSPRSQRAVEGFLFQRNDADALSRAAAKLVQPETVSHVVIRGRVHLLTKKAVGEPGVFGIEDIDSPHGRKVRVRLSSPADYHLAVRAHDEDLLVEVVGRLEKQGTFSWLYDASLTRLIPILDLEDGPFLAAHLLTEVEPRRLRPLPGSEERDDE
jgi:hypothetical protein